MGGTEPGSVPLFFGTSHTRAMNPLLDRRQLLLAGTLAAAMQPTSATPPSGAEAREIELWPDGVPGAQNVTARESLEELARDGAARDRVVWHVTRPLLTWFAPRTAPSRFPPAMDWTISRNV